MAKKKQPTKAELIKEVEKLKEKLKKKSKGWLGRTVATIHMKTSR